MGSGPFSTEASGPRRNPLRKRRLRRRREVLIEAKASREDNPFLSMMMNGEAVITLLGLIIWLEQEAAKQGQKIP